MLPSAVLFISLPWHDVVGGRRAGERAGDFFGWPDHSGAELSRRQTRATIGRWRRKLGRRLVVDSARRLVRGRRSRTRGRRGSSFLSPRNRRMRTIRSSESIEYLTRSAEMGYRKAQYALGADYQGRKWCAEGCGRRPSTGSVLAAQQGSTSAQQDLGKMDPAQAVHYLQMGAERRDPQSEFTLGRPTMSWGAGYRMIAPKAMDYFRRASRDGGPSDGEQIAAALARSAPSRRFASGEALMALVPAPQQTAATRRPANCPAWYDSNFNGRVGLAINYGQVFCLAHPNCNLQLGGHRWHRYLYLQAAETESAALEIAGRWRSG